MARKISGITKAQWRSALNKESREMKRQARKERTKYARRTDHLDMLEARLDTVDRIREWVSAYGDSAKIWSEAVKEERSFWRKYRKWNSSAGMVIAPRHLKRTLRDIDARLDTVDKIVYYARMDCSPTDPKETDHGSHDG